MLYVGDDQGVVSRSPKTYNVQGELLQILSIGMSETIGDEETVERGNNFNFVREAVCKK